MSTIVVSSNNALYHKTYTSGCFWCGEQAMEYVEGVRFVLSGFSGGHTVNPSYQSLFSGDTGHYEAVEVDFNSSEVTYETLLFFFWTSAL